MTIRFARALSSAEGLLAMSLLLITSSVSLFAPVVAPQNPNAVHLAQRLEYPSGSHWLGTDQLGRDLASRLIYGGRYSIMLAVAASLLTLLIGFVVGGTAGYFGGWIDECLHVVINTFQSIPPLCLMVGLAGVMGPGVVGLLIAVVASTWADFSRVVRGETLQWREETFVEGLRAMGAGPFYILFKHLLPNMIGPLIVLITVRMGKVVLSMAALSFLGLGLQPPTPDWGVMINEARPFLRTHPMLFVAPGLCIIAVTLGFNLLGDVLRDAYDVKTVLSGQTEPDLFPAGEHGS